MPVDPIPDPKDDIIPWAVGVPPEAPKIGVLLVGVTLGPATLCVVPLPDPAGTVDGVTLATACPDLPVMAPEGGVQPEGGVPRAGMSPAGALTSGALGSSVDAGITVPLSSPGAASSGSILAAPMSVIPEVTFADTLDESMVIIDRVFISRLDSVDKIPCPKYTTRAISMIVRKIFRMAKTLMSNLITLPSSIHSKLYHCIIYY